MSRDEIIAKNPIVPFVEKRGHKLKKRGENFVTDACPIKQHSKRGHTPVTIYTVKQSWTCHDCKKSGSVIDWLMHEKNLGVGEAMAELAGGPNGNEAVANRKRLIAATYDYLDANGNLVSQTVRYLTKKGERKQFSQRRPDGRGGWIGNLKGVETVLFRLPEITRDIRDGLRIFLSEGEKDVLALVERGFAATCNPMGAGKWRDSYSETLRGADVIIIADKDQDGRNHAQLVASKIHGIAKFVRVLELPDVNGAAVKDPYDYFAAGGDAQQLLALADSAPEWRPEQPNERLSFRSPEQILAMPRNPRANFLGDKLLGIARSLVLAGIGGLGKSRLLLQLLVAFILERLWCGIETHHTKGKPWMLIQTQNGTDRLQDDLERLKKYAGEEWPVVDQNLKVHTLETDRDMMLHLSDPKNQSDLENAIRHHNPIGVAFDPLVDFAIGDLSRDVDMTATCHEIGRISRAGNPERAIVIATHARTGLEAMKKAFGFEAAGFGRNSKNLHSWTRAFINVVPLTEDYDILGLICGKINDGKPFLPFAVRRNPETMIYDPDPDFDISAFREQIETPKKKRKTFTDKPEIVAEIEWRNYQGDLVPELDKEWLAKSIMAEINCSRSTAYRLIDAAAIQHIIKFTKQTEIYAKKKPAK